MRALTWEVNIYYLKHEVHFKKSDLNASQAPLHGFLPPARYSVCQSKIYKVACHSNGPSLLQPEAVPFLRSKAC